MIAPLGTSENPLRVAIIGSGPSGFYAADHLQKQKQLSVEIDMFERLPTPYGLVRGGVAPDHPKIKSVTKIYEKIACHPSFRFYGHVHFGTDITHEDLLRHYHAIIYAVGAQTDRELGIPGEHLANSHAATDFVGWYNGHPDYRHLQFDLTQERVAVIGVGNVAMDVTRILASAPDELQHTDIADYALAALANSNVREIYVLGRRSAAQAAFTTPEIKELGELALADVVVGEKEVTLDAHSEAIAAQDRAITNNMQVLRNYAQAEPQNKPKKIIFRFLVSPVEFIGTDRVEAIKIVHNELVLRDDGSLSAQATDQTEIIPIGLVFRSVGYRGVPLPDVPFNAARGTIPNEKGRVLSPDGDPVTGDYVVGWIKRGPSGVIGTNKPDSVETVETLLADLQADQLNAAEVPSRQAVEALLQARGVEVVSFEDWLILDSIEQANGTQANRTRIKFTSVEEMLAALAAHRNSNAAIT